MFEKSHYIQCTVDALVLQVSMYIQLQAGFLEKNNDALHDSLEQLMIQSTDSFVKQLFPASTAKKNGSSSKKLALISISGKFKVNTIFSKYFVV